ncbi:MAG: hypothetical protein IJS00_06930 [Paludibacteraceae bacterium]|nr:hypothetical protein [Paludibacteraceae bacterium]
MNYRHFLTCLLLTVISLTAVAQKQAVGIHIGFAQPIYRTNIPDVDASATKLHATTLNGLKIGLVYDGTIIKGFGLSMGLNYTFAMHNGKWHDYTWMDEPAQPTTGKPRPLGFLPDFEYRTQYQYHQGEIFVDWQYKFEIAKETYIILYTGPTIQCTFAFTSKDYLRYIVSHDEASLKYPAVESYEAEMDSHFRKLNVTWGVGAGFQYKRYFIRGGYDFGLINPYKEPNFSELGYGDDNYSRTTRGRIDQWQIKLGVYFWQSDDK